MKKGSKFYNFIESNSILNRHLLMTILRINKNKNFLDEFFHGAKN